MRGAVILPGSAVPVPGANTSARLDIQGLRAVAVLLVVLSHLFHWPRGGFIGVDVFFVISGFLITGLLLREFDRTGRISLAGFYRRRVRRIVPAATLVLIATCAAASQIFSVSRFQTTAVDGLWGFLFASNWRFAIEGTDYFTASGPVSPLQHYWSLSVEEQFYLVWPLLILAIGLLVTWKAWSSSHRLVLSAGAMGIVVTTSFSYALVGSESSPTWTYFSTFARVWELGVGALTAIGIRYFVKLPDEYRPLIAWAGLLSIGAGAFLITEDGGGFPAPWAALPVFGTALILGAGASGAHRYLGVMTNRISAYIGDISYSLYLWHWPVIVLLAAVMDVSGFYYAAALTAMFGLSIASYHFVENPIRRSSWPSRRAGPRRARPAGVSRSTGVAAISAFVLIAVSMTAYAVQPVESSAAPVRSADSAVDPSTTGSLGPAGTLLAEEIDAAVGVNEWPELSPSMDEAIKGPQAPGDVAPCGMVARPDPSKCTWGNDGAPRTMMVLGDSAAMTYVEVLKNFAETSEGQWTVRSEAMFGCAFVDMITVNISTELGAACPNRKAEAIRVVNEVRPDVVVIANFYSSLSPTVWKDVMTRLTDQFESNVGKIVFLSAPPSDIDIGECFSRVSTPADCVSRVTPLWAARAEVEKTMAATVGGVFVDSRPWFCTPDGYCPSFVGTTPVKSDLSHMTPAYARLISPSVAEALRGIGL